MKAENNKMKIDRLLYIIRHPFIVYEQHRVKEIKMQRKWRGKSPDKTYYVIRCDLPGCGLFAIFMYVLDHIAYAVDQGYEPILDSEKYECLYKEDKPVKGTKDPWKYYFEPISELKKSDMWKMKNVVYGRIRFPRYKGIYYYKEKERNILPTKERIEELYKLVEKYIRFCPELQRELDASVKELENKRLLGVHVRGTDMYTAGKQHPIPNGKTKDFSYIDEILQKYNLDGIFLCTDTENTVHLFREYYGEKLYVTDSIRQKDDTGTGIHKDTSLGKNRKNHKYLMGKEVIKDMYMLSKCNVLICGTSNVAYAAIIYNGNKYEKIYYLV